MLENTIKNFCIRAATTGMLAFSAGCESSQDIQSSETQAVDAQADSSDTDASNTDYSFRSADYGTSQGKDAVPETGDSNDAANECPVEVQCKHYMSPLEDDDPMLGDKCAPVSIIWWGDYQDKYNRDFWEHILPLLKQDYLSTGKAKLVFRDFPLDGIHPMAQVAAEAAECAGEQGRYWEFHDKLFSEQAEQGDGFINFEFIYLKIWAAEIGLDMSKFKYCFESRLYEEEVLNDYKDGENAGVFGVPTFFINDEMVFGFSSDYSEYTKIIDEKLNEQCE